jgi:hypothetical protein
MADETKVQEPNAPSSPKTSSRRATWLTFLIGILVVAAIILIVFMALLAAQYDQNVKKAKPKGMTFKGFTANANLSDIKPWCRETRYAIAYVNNTIQGPWSDFTLGNPPIQSTFETFPELEISDDPNRQPNWTVVVSRIIWENGAEVPGSRLDGLVVAWQSATTFIDYNNPCQEAYLPPQPTAPYPAFGVPDGNGTTWQRAINPNTETPWCVPWKARAFFRAANNLTSLWSPWSLQTWTSLEFVNPTFTVARPPGPDVSSLRLYWAPNTLLLVANASLVIEYSTDSVNFTTFTEPWPATFGQRTSPEFAAEWISSTLLKPLGSGGLGIRLDFTIEWTPATSSDDILTFATFQSNSPNASIQTVRIPYRAQAPTVLNALGFSDNDTVQLINRGSDAISSRYINFFYTKANVVAEGNYFVGIPGEEMVDTRNLCAGIYPSQPLPPRFVGFTYNLANPDQPPPS